MFKKFAWLGTAAVALALATPSFATMRMNPGIIIERAFNSPIVTLKIEESRARVVELIINGKSYATQTLSGKASLQELQFHVDLSELGEGKNQVEARMYDENGVLIGTEKSVLEVETSVELPVEITDPKQGSTLQGLVEIKIGMKRKFSKPYVSFMIDGEWKAIRNFEPFTYSWDTETVANGWHELQVWVVGDDNLTVRSRKVRVFVNNPGGRTNRVPVATPPAVAPAVVPTGATMSNLVVGTLAKPQGVTVSPTKGNGVATSVRMLTPTGKRMAQPKAPAKPTTIKPEVRPVVKTTLPAVTRTTKPVVSASVSKPTPQPKVAPVTKTSSIVTLMRGTQLPNIGGLQIVLNQTLVNFPDVQPYIDSGVAFTPFRHLYQHAGGKVVWAHQAKTVKATGIGNDIRLKIGSAMAKLGQKDISMEHVAFLLRGRTIVPLSFIQEALKVDVKVDTKTGHVLITKPK